MSAAQKGEFKSMYQHCLGLSKQQLEEAPRWAQMAAEAGDYIGRQDWAVELGSSQKAFEVWDAFWRDGNASALPAISILFRQGVPDSTAGQPDYVRAYAYAFMYFKIEEAARATGASWKSTSKHLGSLVKLENSVRNLGGKLNPQEQLQAEALAAQLLSENTNCCTGSF